LRPPRDHLRRATFTGAADGQARKKRRALSDKLDHIPSHIIADLNKAKGLLQ
jgi:hypothetical protein